MDTLTLLQIIFGAVGLLVVLHITAILVFRSHIKNYELNQHNFLTKHLEHLKETTAAHQAAIDQQVKTFITHHSAALKEFQKKNTEFMAGQHELYETHLEVLSISYDTYVKKVEQTNLQFKSLLDKLGDSLNHYKEISTTLLTNYKKLETLTDKTREMVAEHEKMVSDYNSEFEELLRMLKTNAENKLTQVTADGEYRFREAVKGNEAAIESLVSHTRTELNELFASEHFIRFNDNVQEVKSTFQSNYRRFQIELAEINEQFKDALYRIDEEKKKKKSWF